MPEHAPSDDAFYVPDGDRYVATAHTRGPWDPRAQHGGPVCALLAHALETAHPRDDARSARVCVELLRPVPIATLSISTEVIRPGRKVELLGATMSAGDEVVALARAWRIRAADVGLPEPSGRVLPAPEQASEEPFFAVHGEVGWHTAIEARFVEGAWRQPGPASVWLRSLLPLLPGVPLTGWSQVLAVADAGNGVSSVLDFRGHMFINTDLTVGCHRLPVGEWIHLDAQTVIDPQGIGLATTNLSDERGPIGRGMQALFVDAVG